MYHFGVVKALHDNGLLPKVITGSSVGALVGAFVCSRPESELPALFEPDAFNFDVFDAIEG